MPLIGGVADIGLFLLLLLLLLTRPGVLALLSVEFAFESLVAVDAVVEVESSEFEVESAFDDFDLWGILKLDPLNDCVVRPSALLSAKLGFGVELVLLLLVEFELLF